MKRLIATVFLLAIATLNASAANNSYKEAAIEAARWVRSCAVKTEQGKAWPSDPQDPKSINATLYAGTPGVILFFLEAYHSTADKTYLEDARAGADQLASALSNEKESGLYEGIAGIGFALAETFKATGEAKYREGALRCAHVLRDRAAKAGRGVEWNDSTDIIGGGAGIGLFLMYAARELKEPSLLELAILDARHLIELATPEANGLKWAMSPSFKRLMPNFSHGTAGIAYFMATLYQETKETEFLAAARAGAKYLQSVAKTEGDACLIFHNEPDGKDLYYLGWCHGPVGTARLFYRLYQVTGDRVWMDWVKRSARAVMQSGIPEKQTPGFWNNVSQCCGSAGVVEFFLSLYQVTHEIEHLNFAKRVTANLLQRATRDTSGLRWVQAEHRVKPDLLIAQTGYMQGASGIGMMLLRLDDFERDKKPAIRFPDSPF